MEHEVHVANTSCGMPSSNLQIFCLLCWWHTLRNVAGVVNIARPTACEKMGGGAVPWVARIVNEKEPRGTVLSESERMYTAISNG
eukprot:1144448-Pelagomonas_calceolata.AAC.7